MTARAHIVASSARSSRRSARAYERSMADRVRKNSPHKQPRRLRDTHRVMPEEPMNPDLVGFVQRVVDATNAKDIDAIANSYAPDAVLDNATGILGPFEGRAAIRRLYEEWWAAYEDYEQKVEEIGDLGNGVIFVVLLQRARLQGATAWVREDYAVVATWANGLIERQTIYRDTNEARADAERLAEERADG
jgi:ketosteroid isomerase-like protein